MRKICKSNSSLSPFLRRLLTCESKTLRATQTANLAKLLRRKLAIEQQMAESIRRLEHVYKAGAKDVALVAKQRREEMERLSVAEKAVAERG